MVARLGLQIAQEELAALNYSDSTREETESTASSKLARTQEEIMSEVQMNNIVRAVQDAAAYPVRVRAITRARRSRRRTFATRPQPMRLQSK